MTDQANAATPDDQRTRIRDAAIDQFGRYGFKGASVRGIAAAAGVSPGLVQHHFSTKEKLREECDAYALSVIREIRVTVVGGGLAKDGPDVVTQTVPRLAHVWPYLTRGLLDDDSDLATAWFRLAAEEYRKAFTDERFGDAIKPGDDLDAIVATYAAMQLGVGVFMNEISRYLNSDADAPETLARIAKARTLLAGRQLVHEEVAQAIEEGLDDYLRQVRAQPQPDSDPDPDPGHTDPSERSSPG